MALKKIIYRWQLNDLERGDQVEFFPDIIHVLPWQLEARVHSWDIHFGHRIGINFISRDAKDPSALYLLTYDRQDLLPTDSGAIDVRDHAVIQCPRITPREKEYEEYISILNSD